MSTTPSSNRQFVFGVDLDGTCADFYEGLRPIAAQWLGVDIETLPREVAWNPPEWGVDQAASLIVALVRRIRQNSLCVMPSSRLNGSSLLPIRVVNTTRNTFKEDR